MPGATLPVTKTLSVQQAAHVLGLPVRTCYAYVNSGIIPSLRVSHRILILKSVVETLLGEGRFPPPAPGPSLSTEEITPW